MNFCKFYNKTMNSIFKLWNFIAGDNSERDNSEEINIISGTLYLIFVLLFTVIGGLIIRIFIRIMIVEILFNSLIWIYEHTNSKCELKQ